MPRPSRVASRDWVSYGILYETLAGAAAARICQSELWAASTTTAWYTEVPGLFGIQPVDTPELRQQALDRLRALPAYIDTEIANLRHGLERGYSAPRLTVAPAVNEVRQLANADSPLLSPGVRGGDAGRDSSTGPGADRENSRRDAGHYRPPFPGSDDRGFSERPERRSAIYFRDRRGGAEILRHRAGPR
ncbi:MAG: DUF885 family protein [Xanthomonadales bacterium]|nr:DUF885 family protein [Xanthomonadales bacterium]